MIGRSSVACRPIGVAIAIPEPVRRASCSAARASFGDPLARAIPTHVTLLPPTEVDDATACRVRATCAAVAGATTPFDVAPARHRRPSGRCRRSSSSRWPEGIADCEPLERRVRAGPLARDLDFYYHPHVTVAHHVADGRARPGLRRTSPTTPCTFEVDDFHLYEHGADGVWRPVDEPSPSTGPEHVDACASASSTGQGHSRG